jgi:SulP family sulfate permease
VALAAVAVSIVVLSVTPLAELGFRTVGALPAGLPALTLPSLQVRDIDGVVPLAFACFLLAYIEGVSAARTLAERHGREIDPRQELLALAAANAAAAFGQGYPVAGGLSQSTVNERAGAATPLALVFASLAIGLTLLFLTGLLANLPDVVLAAIVLVAVAGLIDVAALRRVWTLSKLEFWVALAAFAGVLLLGILQGVLLAAIVSVALLIHRAAHPLVARLGRVPGTRRYSDCARHPDNELIPGVLIVRVEAGLMYFNATEIRDRVRALVAAEGAPLHTVVWDLSASPFVDIAGAELLRDIRRELAARGVPLRLVEAHAAVRELLRKVLGLTEEEINRKTSVDDAVSAAGAGR